MFRPFGAPWVSTGLVVELIDARGARPRPTPQPADSRKAASSALRATVRPVAHEDEWLDAEAAARYINLPLRSIYRLLHEGRLEAVRFAVRVRRHELDACLERCRIRPGEAAHLNAYPGGASRVAEPPLTKQGRPDRRYGRRY